MDRTAVLEKIRPIFNDVFDDELLITSETCADDIEDWDSLAQINLIVAMEKMFNVKFALADLLALMNVGDMVELILAKSQQ